MKGLRLIVRSRSGTRPRVAAIKHVGIIMSLQGGPYIEKSDQSVQAADKDSLRAVSNAFMSSERQAGDKEGLVHGKAQDVHA